MRLLKLFNYTPESQLGRVFPYQPVFDATNYHLRFDYIDMGKVKFPSGATHLKLRYGVLDMDFNNMTYERYTAAPVLIDKNFTGGTLELILDDVPVIEHLCIPLLGMRLYQSTGAGMVPLNDEKFVSMSVLGSGN